MLWERFHRVSHLYRQSIFSAYFLAACTACALKPTIMFSVLSWISQWEAPLLLTHSPLTNTVYTASASPSSLWVLYSASVKTVRGRLTHVIGRAREAADEKRRQCSGFAACVQPTEPLVSYKESHRPTGAINSNIDGFICSRRKPAQQNPPFPAHFLPALHSAVYEMYF